jgi:DNA-binding HxlR family transcriptional regulator
VRGEASVLFVVDPGRDQAKAFSTCEELAVQFAITLLEGKWRVPILLQLQSGPIHFGELKRRLSPVSKKVLNQHLRQMVRDELIVRKDLAGKKCRGWSHVGTSQSRVRRASLEVILMRSVIQV